MGSLRRPPNLCGEMPEDFSLFYNHITFFILYTDIKINFSHHKIYFKLPEKPYKTLKDSKILVKICELKKLLHLCLHSKDGVIYGEY